MSKFINKALQNVLTRADELHDSAAVAMDKLDSIGGIPPQEQAEMELTKQAILQDFDDIYFGIRDLIVIAETYGGK